MFAKSMLAVGFSRMRSWRLFGIAGLLLGALCLGWWFRPLRLRPVLRVQWIEAPVAGSMGWEGHQRDGLRMTVMTALECLVDAVVLYDPLAGSEPPPLADGYQIQVLGRRQGQELNLPLRWRRGNGPWQTVDASWLPAHEALRGLFARVPFDVPLHRLDHLVPSTAEATLDLLSYIRGSTGLDRAVVVHQQTLHLVESFPKVALCWVAYGTASQQRMLEQGNQDPRYQQEADRAYRKALELWPGLPVAAGRLAQLKTDLGDHPEAFRVLSKALRAHPRSELLLRQVGYACRVAGRLDIALKALTRHHVLTGKSPGIENAYLYSGDLDAFERGIATEAEVMFWSPAHRFYLGYVSLVRGDRAQAVARLQPPSGLRWPTERFGRLGHLYALIARGELDQARIALQEFSSFFVAARLPDGEFLFKLGEAAALLGDQGKALDLVHRAANHGFHCREWYAGSPLLAGIRDTPRFQLLLKMLDEKQKQYRQVVDAADFGL